MTTEPAIISTYRTISKLEDVLDHLRVDLVKLQAIEALPVHKTVRKCLVRAIQNVEGALSAFKHNKKKESHHEKTGKVVNV